MKRVHIVNNLRIFQNSTISQCIVFTRKTLELWHVSTLFVGHLRVVCISIFIQRRFKWIKWFNILLKSFIFLKLVVKLLNSEVVYVVQWMLDMYSIVIILMFWAARVSRLYVRYNKWFEYNCNIFYLFMFYFLYRYWCTRPEIDPQEVETYRGLKFLI
jgi:hypothetical protein